MSALCTLNDLNVLLITVHVWEKHKKSKDLPVVLTSLVSI